MVMIILFGDISSDHLTITIHSNICHPPHLQYTVDLLIFNTAVLESWFLVPVLPSAGRGGENYQPRAEQVSDLTSIRANCSGDNKMRVGHHGQSGPVSQARRPQ